MNDFDKEFLTKAIQKAQESVLKGGFPAGAVIVKNKQIIGSGISVGNTLHDPTSHGDIAAIRDACKNLKNTDLSGCTLYTSLEPCLMCFGAAMWGSIFKIVYAVAREKLSPEYYGGVCGAKNLANQTLRSPLLEHGEELEAASLLVVLDWEKSQ